MTPLFACAHLALVSVAGMIASQAPPSPNATAVKTATAAATVAVPQAAPVTGAQADPQQASIDKQKASVRLQVGEGGEAAPFYTTPWESPRVIPLPVTCDPMSEFDLLPLVHEAAVAQDLDPILLRAVIRRESGSLACAVSDKGAVGLMQLMPDTAKQFGVDPYDAKANVGAGSKYLKQLLTRYKGDTKLALAAYNAGPALVDMAAGVPAIPETTAYVEAILKDVASNTRPVVVVPKPK